MAHLRNESNAKRADKLPPEKPILSLRFAAQGRLGAHSVAEAGSALRSAAGQNLAAVGGRHSLAEAVLFLALTLLRLIGTQHVGVLLSSFDMLNIRRDGPGGSSRLFLSAARLGRQGINYTVKSQILSTGNFAKILRRL